MKLAILCAAAAVLAAASARPAELISGRAKVVDGDSLEIGTVRIRLNAIDAFEGRQTCRRDGTEWPCGAEAAALLRQLVGGAEIRCEKIDTDTYGRTVAICRSASTPDLGAAMVEAGYALAYREFGNDYVDEEDVARAARRGAWAGEFVAPWDERHGGGARRARTSRNDRTSAPAGGAAVPTTTSGAPGDCPEPRIKGNLNDRERIYHVPGSPSYEATKINERKGERWFCTEEEARAAGWRPPRR